MGTPEHRLSAYLGSLTSRQLSTETRHRIAQSLLDWFTAGISGASLPASGALRRLAATLFSGDDTVAVFGGPNAVSSMGAAFCNAGITHLREIDDAHRTAMLHPGIVAVTPAMTIASSMPVTQQQFEAAIVAGYEVAIRAGEVLGSGHAGKFHMTATAGSLAAAAASAVALGLDGKQIHHALGIAATQAAGLWQFVDDQAHESKALHPAFAVRNGLTAAYAAQAGYPGAQHFMNGTRGLYALLHGDGDPAMLDHALGATDRISSTTIKPWPVCGQLFTVIDATQALINAHDIRVDEIESVDIAIFPQALRIARVHWPVAPAQTSFSGRYCVAVLLLTGKLGIQETESPDLTNPGLLALADRITLQARPDYADAFPERRPGTVTIRLKNGDTISATRDIRQGDPEAPFNWAGLESRLRNLAPGIPEERAVAISTWCDRQQHTPTDAPFTPPTPDLFD
ncbi:MAG TPA: MmgE/PrpD family protein [Advenella sp.]|nr:MmgE/PrpD family protein [Advenella sp.]